MIQRLNTVIRFYQKTILIQIFFLFDQLKTKFWKIFFIIATSVWYQFQNNITRYKSLIKFLRTQAKMAKGHKLRKNRILKNNSKIWHPWLIESYRRTHDGLHVPLIMWLSSCASHHVPLIMCPSSCAPHHVHMLEQKVDSADIICLKLTVAYIESWYRVSWMIIFPCSKVVKCLMFTEYHCM